MLINSHEKEKTVSHKLSGNIALVTGGSSGLGLATAKRFASEGAYVYITGRRQRELATAVDELGPHARAISGDISNLTDLDLLFADIREEKGRLDVLFANAGLGEFAPLGQITEEHFDKTFGVNVRGTLFTVQKALPLMPDGAVIVVNASMVSVKGFPAFGVYAASKAALRSFVRTWSNELKDRKIRVNAISPGTVVTPGYQTGLGMSDEQIHEFEAQAAAVTPWAAPARPTR